MHILDLSDFETVDLVFAKWVIFSIVADAALLSRRADRLGQGRVCCVETGLARLMMCM